MRLVSAALLALGIAGPVPLAAQGDSAPLKFVSPRRHQTSIGTSKAELAVMPPAGAEVTKVTLTIDGVVASEKTAPPWVFTWDAGDGTKGHRLDAAATF